MPATPPGLVSWPDVHDGGDEIVVGGLKTLVGLLEAQVTSLLDEAIGHPSAAAEGGYGGWHSATQSYATDDEGLYGGSEELPVGGEPELPAQASAEEVLPLDW